MNDDNMGVDEALAEDDVFAAPANNNIAPQNQAQLANRERQNNLG